MQDVAFKNTNFFIFWKWELCKGNPILYLISEKMQKKVAKLATISGCIFEDKRWTEPKKYGKISIRNEALKSGADGE